jgi:riboflavin synthase alpha subunit
MAGVKGQESYDLLRSSFSNMFKTVNSLVKEGKVTVDGISCTSGDVSRWRL